MGRPMTTGMLENSVETSIDRVNVQGFIQLVEALSEVSSTSLDKAEVSTRPAIFDLV